VGLIALLASKESIRAEIPIAVEVGNLGYVAQLVRLPRLSTLARIMLRSLHTIPLEEEMWNSGNSAEAQRGVPCPGSWIVRKSAPVKLSAAPIAFDVRPRALVPAILFDTGLKTQGEKLAKIIRKARRRTDGP